MKKYPLGIREEVVSRIRAGESQRALSREYEISPAVADPGLSQILCKHRNAVQIEQNLFKAEVAQAAAALFSK